jgi:uncharacterized protein YjbJ (UPF0337 family)
MEHSMNIDTLAGEGTNLKGQFKESLGDAAGDPLLQRDGIADQLSGNIRKGFGALRDFSRDQPLLAAVGAGAVLIALFGNLRGKRR